VTLLDRLQFDVFADYYKRYRPSFSTFFLNSTAHYQHAYWDSFEPDKYAAEGRAGSVGHYSEAIPFGYRQMDALIGKFFRLVGDDATLILCTALSQEPLAKGDKRIRYRPIDFERFAALARVVEYRLSPVMGELFNLEFGTVAAAEDAHRNLLKIKIDGESIMRIERDGHRLFCSCRPKEATPMDAVVVCGEASTTLSKLVYRVPTSKVADHHPDGVLWVRTGRRHSGASGRVPLVGVAPTILSLFGISPPAHMRGPVFIHS